jgi:hypothetical protein
MTRFQPIVFLIDVMVAAFPPADLTIEHIADLLWRATCRKRG